MMACATSGMMLSVDGWETRHRDGRGSADPCQIQFIRIFDNCLPIAQWLMSSCMPAVWRARQLGWPLRRLPQQLAEGCQAMRCPVCAIPDPTGELCGRCLDRPPHFDRVVAPFMYEFPITVLIQGLKYRGNLACARPLAVGIGRSTGRRTLPGSDHSDAAHARAIGEPWIQSGHGNFATGGSGIWPGHFRRHLSPDARQRPAGDPAMEATRDKCAQCLCV